MINATEVKKLREKTGLPMMACKKALVESEGDQEKAIEILRIKNSKIEVKLSTEHSNSIHLIAGKIGNQIKC